MSLAPSDSFTREALNAAFLSQNEDNNYGGVLSLSNSSSDPIENVQDALNNVLAILPSVNAFYVSFKKITVTLNASAETTDLVSGQIAQSPSNSLTAEGALVLAPYNLCFLRRVNQGGMLTDSLGKRVFGRIATITGGYRLTTYTRLAGSEQTLSIGSAIQCELWYPVLFSGQNRPTYDEFLTIFTDNIVQEIPDGSASLRGLVGTSSQAFSGTKTFNNGIAVGSRLSSSGYLEQGVQNLSMSGSAVTISPSKSVVVLSGGLTSLAGISSNIDGTRMLVINGQAGAISVLSQDSGALASDRLTFSLTLNQNESFECIYISSISRWVRV